MSIDTLEFYRKIYDPLFKKGYTRKSDRAASALKQLKQYTSSNNIKIASVIDVGCAWGKSLKYWGKKKVTVTGVDVSKIAVKYCRKKGYKCILASATNLSFADDNSFDLYMATDMYEHLRKDDIDNALDEAIRITKRFFLIRPHPAKDKRKTLHLSVFSLSKWRDIFESHGLKVIHFGVDDIDTHLNSFLLKKS